jgi:NAD-dependent dihydropyrimidine dehydrogenase PreA subunit
VIEKIDGALCIKCGLCENICATDVLRMDDHGVQIAYPDDCSNCMECLFVCPTDAVVLTPKMPKKFDARLRWQQIKEALAPKT